ncbi:uncharacterized protein LOC143284532 [Babylonia areolata]|uniref:uncharacterized protein LOC143284532 n=1 Tax=Babylonia areolata TaxID=304850 RepID=UPI003FD33311
MATLKEELSWKCFALRFHRVDAFCTAQWRWHPAVFIAYRLLMPAYTIFALIHFLVSVHPTARVLAFLTIWTYLAEMLFFLTGAGLAVLYWRRPHHFRNRSPGESSGPEGVADPAVDGGGVSVSYRANYGSANRREGGEHPETMTSGDVVLGRGGRGGEESVVNHRAESLEMLRARNVSLLPWHVQFYWALGNVVQVVAVVVTVVYFVALYPSMRDQIGDVNLYDINIHGINSVMILIDTAVGARPVRLLHALYPILFGATYVVFSVIFWAVDPENNVLYKDVLDWNQPGISIGVVLGLAVIGIPLLQLAHFGLYKLRLKLYQFVYGEPYL